MMNAALKRWISWAMLLLATVAALALLPVTSWAVDEVDAPEPAVAAPADEPAAAAAEEAPAATQADQAEAGQKQVSEPAAVSSEPVPESGAGGESAPVAEEPSTPVADSDYSAEPPADPAIPAETAEAPDASVGQDADEPTAEVETTPTTSVAEPVANPLSEPEEAASAVTAKPRLANDASTTPSTPADDAAKRPLADGTYILSWAKSSSDIVQSAAASRKAGANVQLGKADPAKRQRWIIKYAVDQGFYTIVNEFSKKALTVSSGKSGANVFQDALQAGARKQLWSIVKSGSGYMFVPKANSKLAITGVKAKGGYNLVLRSAKGSKSQRFKAKDEGIVRNGIYSLAPANNPKKAATVLKYSMDDKAKLQWYTNKKNMNQKFSVLYMGQGQYTLQLVHSGKFLGMDGSAVVQASDGNAQAQRWTVTWNKTGLALKNVATGKRLYVPKATAKNKLLLSTAKPKNDAAQRFALTERRLVNNGTYIIHAFTGNRALAVQNGSVAELANLDAETTSKGNSQKFRIKYVKGYYRITNLKSKLVVGYASGKAGANVRQRKNSKTDQQLFKAVVVPTGGIKFVGVHGGKVLDIAGTKNMSGANVRMANADDSNEQRWWLERTKIDKTEAIVDRALRMAQARGSATNWYLAVDVKNHRTMVLKRSGNTWKLAKNWLCSVGAPSTPTVLGSYTVGIKGYSFGEGYTCYYYTQFWGDYLFHSVKYYQGTFKVKDGRLGKDVSEGCVRLPIKQAKWIYDNIPYDTSVRTYK